MIALRKTLESDLPIFFEHQSDPDAASMADFPSRDEESFMNHWHTKVLNRPDGIVKTILFENEVAGNIVSWKQDGFQEVGYWLGKKYWGKGIASAALAQFLTLIPVRPLYAYAAKHNIASRRVLEKCGFTLHREEQDGNIFQLL